jgi:hypothetical protein
MSIEGYVRELDKTQDTWATWRVAPHAFRLVVVDEFQRRGGIGWRRLSQPRNCRWTTGPGHLNCGRPAVVELARGSKARPQYWGYCAQHLYGRHWEAPRLLSVVAVAEDEQP